MGETKTVDMVLCLPTRVRIEIGWDAHGEAVARGVRGRTTTQPEITLEEVCEALDYDELAEWDRDPAATAAEEA